ncbi:NUDIX hydrolase [Streptomyces sp. HNM0574]|uniref:NUDIX domain-containing protein n=1 Tax=Streptomyces sp. HNM0574 TaxID=2714954 RepID=UPI00146A5A95|nr:NUDIX hydrolase [Streptomyces sp. HNM0574]
MTGAREVADVTGAAPVRPVVRAAGCVLWRAAAGAEGIEIALISRPKWGDWSHPKGKLDPGETFAGAAVREVFEETGMSCELGAPLPTLRYPASGRPKEVRYWAAEATGGTFVPNKEVDRLIWLPPTAARVRLTHPHDRPLVDALLTALAADPVG